MSNSESHAGENQTVSGVFILVGFSYLGELQILLYLVFLPSYLFALMGNLIITLLIKLNPSLHTPMYFFLVNLSVSGICFITSVIPQLLVHLLVEEAQFFVLNLAGLTGCCLLAVMAYDRYVAICRPLHYATILSGQVCAWLAGASWLIGILSAGAQTTQLFSLPFCGSHRIHHYFCTAQGLHKMLCSNPWKNMIFSFVVLVLFVMGPFLLILLSYVCIISTILKLSTVEGRRKAFSTCSSHLTVVALLYGSAFVSHLKPASSSNPEHDQLSFLVYTVVTPVLNPIIYTLRNKEVKAAFRNTVGKAKFPRSWRY
nr:olfactory receptor 2D3-like [Pelodiscus sinensis]|eukprot:XP_006134625.2 olfactory receptor 2D3-like [Pelodiscus sinensis]